MARRYYAQAAEAGNIKAMHNLAVLYAEGIDGKPDYRQASQLFRKAAERGLRDSQYNLAILYARGLGVDQNFGESFKWFALAANQGDADAQKKREDVAARLDAQTLLAARLAVQTWMAQPADAVANDSPPLGGLGPRRNLAQPQGHRPQLRPAPPAHAPAGVEHAASRTPRSRRSAAGPAALAIRARGLREGRQPWRARPPCRSWEGAAGIARNGRPDGQADERTVMPLRHANES